MTQPTTDTPPRWAVLAYFLHDGGWRMRALDTYEDAVDEARRWLGDQHRRAVIVGPPLGDAERQT